MAFLYLAVQKLVEPYGANGRIDPLVASWAPHVPFLLLGLVLLFRARRSA